jgi:hypothetical protein
MNEREVDRIMNELEGRTLLANKLGENITELSRENSLLTMSKKQREGELQLEVSRLEEQVATMKIGKDDVERSFAQLQAILKDQRRAEKRHKLEVIAQKGDIKALENRIGDLKRELEKKEQIMGSKLSEMHESRLVLSKQWQQERNVVLELESKLKIKTEEFLQQQQIMEERLVVLQNELTEKNSYISQLETKVESYKKGVPVLESRIDELTKENRSSLSRVNELVQKLKEVEESHEELAKKKKERAKRRMDLISQFVDEESKLNNVLVDTLKLGGGGGGLVNSQAISLGSDLLPPPFPSTLISSSDRYGHLVSTGNGNMNSHRANAMYKSQSQSDWKHSQRRTPYSTSDNMTLETLDTTIDFDSALENILNGASVRNELDNANLFDLNT